MPIQPTEARDLNPFQADKRNGRLLLVTITAYIGAMGLLLNQPSVTPQELLPFAIPSWLALYSLNIKHAWDVAVRKQRGKDVENSITSDSQPPEKNLNPIRIGTDPLNEEPDPATVEAFINYLTRKAKVVQ